MMDKFERYCKLSEVEERCLSRSGYLKALAAAWSMAILVMAGLLFNAYDHGTWPLPLGFLLTMLMTLGSLGLLALWGLDHFVFTKHLNALFGAVRQLEMGARDAPAIRSIMQRTQGKCRAIGWASWFYLAPVLVFSLLSGAVLLGGTDRLFTANPDLFYMNTHYLSIVLALLQLSAAIWMMAARPSRERRTDAFSLTAAKTRAVSTDAKERQDVPPRSAIL